MTVTIEFFENETRLKPFFEGIDEFAKLHLSTADSVDEEDRGAKTFADPIEHYATLAAWEVSIVDTPLTQALIRAEQAGDAA